MKIIKTIILILAATFSLSACDSEENITPSGNYSPIRGGFPQGDSEYDEIINNIKNVFGVYLLYKDVTVEDLNRSWTSQQTSGIYVAGYEDERDALAWNLPEEQLPFYVNYFNDYIFPNISPEFANMVMPVKMYMIHNLRTEELDFGEGNNQPSTTTDPRVMIMKGNFDSWAISFTEEMMNSLNADYALKQLRCMLLIELINRIDVRAESPDEFWAGLNFNTTIEYEKENDPNYCFNLGFITRINNNFGTGRAKEVFIESNVFKSSEYWAKTSANYNLFTEYIKNAMWLTPEEFELRYSTDKYPIVKEKYDIVVKHMLDKYGINIVGIARGKNK